MKKLLFLTVLGTVMVLSQKSYAQFGVSYHQSDLPFVGLNYTINETIMPEFRLGTNNFFQNIAPELIVAYKFYTAENFNAYAGAGARFNVFEGVVIPVGLNIYPFAERRFGFHMELAPIIFFEGGNILEDGALLRSSWGIRYRF